MSLEIGFNWKDQYGRSAKSAILVDAATTPEEVLALAGLLQACSDGAIDDVWETHDYTRSGGALIAATDTTMSVKDVCYILFRSSVGKVVTVTLVKPALAILLNDEVLIKTHALVVAIKDAAELYLKDNAGNPIVDIIEGYRSRNKSNPKQ